VPLPYLRWIRHRARSCGCATARVSMVSRGLTDRCDGNPEGAPLREGVDVPVWVVPRTLSEDARLRRLARRAAGRACGSKGGVHRCARTWTGAWSRERQSKNSRAWSCTPACLARMGQRTSSSCCRRRRPRTGWCSKGAGAGRQIERPSQVETSPGSRHHVGVKAVTTESVRFDGVSAIGRHTDASPRLPADVSGSPLGT
jgi:hypothetical protein